MFKYLEWYGKIFQKQKFDIIWYKEIDIKNNFYRQSRE